MQVYAFQTIEKKALKESIKQLLYHGTVRKFSSKQQYHTYKSNAVNYVLFSVIFRTLQLAQTGLMTGWLAKMQMNVGVSL